MKISTDRNWKVESQTFNGPEKTHEKKYTVILSTHIREILIVYFYN